MPDLPALTFRFAAPADRDDLLRIWVASFPDEPAAARQWIERLHTADNCLLAAAGGRTVSMVFLLAAELCHGDAPPLPMQYIYAAATLPEVRGKGVFAALLREAHAAGQRRGVWGSYLRPASDRLAGYYRRLGYRPYFGGVRETYTAERLSGIPPAALTNCTGDYAAVRRRCLRTRDGGYALLAAAMEDAAAAAAVCLTDGAGCLFAEMAETDTAAERVVHVRELIAPPERRLAYLAALAERLPAERYIVTRPAESGEAAEAHGLLFKLTDEPGGVPGDDTDGGLTAYMGLALD